MSAVHRFVGRFKIIAAERVTYHRLSLRMIEVNLFLRKWDSSSNSEKLGSLIAKASLPGSHQMASLSSSYFSKCQSWSGNCMLLSKRGTLATLGFISPSCLGLPAAFAASGLSLSTLRFLDAGLMFDVGSTATLVSSLSLSSFDRLSASMERIFKEGEMCMDLLLLMQMKELFNIFVL